MEKPCFEDQEMIQEFLVESYENLSQLDQNLVELEKRPQDAQLLGSIFRTFHTIKGACGFLAFSTLEKITHQSENLLSQLRDGKRTLKPELVSLILEAVDAVRAVLASIEASGKEGEAPFEELIGRLRLACQSDVVVVPPPAPVESSPDKAAQPAVEPPPVKEPSAPKEPIQAAKTQDAKPPEGMQERRRSPRGEDEEYVKPAMAAEANIRVGVSLLDKLMDLVGELVLTRNQILQSNAEREDPTLNATSQRLNLITSELQEGVMKTRMQPIGVVWNNLPRVVRDMSVFLNKQIQLKMDGADTELDRTIIEAIKDPLIHLVRNACDHGIEMPDVRIAGGKPAQGTMTLRAYHEGGQVNIEIGDDGAGIDVDRVKQKAVENGLLRTEQAEKLTDREAFALIFQPGFSTAQKVTNLSGRGVGMDVVKSHIEKIGGIVDITSRRGEGTTVKIRIPLTLAIIPGLVITSGGERFVIPQVSLLELIRLDDDSGSKHIEYVHGTAVYRRRGTLLPITYLNQVLGLESPDGTEASSLVVLQADDRQFGLVVDGINDTQEIVVKPLGKQLKGLTLYAGATIMGDGRVALILDVPGIGQRSGVFGEVREPVRVVEKQSAHGEMEKQRLLLFRAGSFERVAVPLSLVARLEEFPQSAIEHASGGMVVQYRDRILPLVLLRSVLESQNSGDNELPDPAPVVVFNDGDRSVGMVVDEIIDVIEEAVTVRKKSGREGLLGSAVIGSRVTDFLDFHAVTRASRGDWDASASGQTRDKRILIVDASAFARGMIRSGLDIAGYLIEEAASVEGAIRVLERRPVHIVLTALDLPRKGSSSLLAAMKKQPEWASIPMLAIAEPFTRAKAAAALEAGFNDCQAKFDGEHLLESIAGLIPAPYSDEAELVNAAGGN